MLTVVLTGGIGSGKSTVAELFAALGVPVIKSDMVAREVVLPSTDALKQIVAHFGDEVLLENGHLNREEIRRRIFAKPSSRIWLEKLLHPIILKRIAEQITTFSYPYCIVEIPLIFLANQYPFINRILVVDADEKTQIERSCQRDSSTQPNEVRAIIATQASRQQRLKFADDILNNDLSIDELREQIKGLHEKYLALAKQY